MDDKIICGLCPNACSLSEGQTGACRGRKRSGGKIVPINYGCITSAALDPIEKKPLKHFYPGSFILSVGSFGCNLHCPFCQNFEISQSGKEFPHQPVTAEALAETAREMADKSPGNLGVAFTYNEPLIGYEFVLDTSKLLRNMGLSSVLVSNGMISEEYWRAMLPYIDAANIDLKGWRQEFYDWCGGDLATVKRNIELAAGKIHLEVTTLIIPGMNDSVEDMKEEASWLASLSTEIPLHISRYFPRWRSEIPETPVGKIKELAGTAGEYLKYVYTGNC